MKDGIVLYKPERNELWYRRNLLADKKTMAYNHAYGGTIEFPVEKWQAWYDKWNDEKHFYRYLKNTKTGEYVGEVAWHYEDERCLIDVVVEARYRSSGYGTAGLKLLMDEARKAGITVIYDDIAIDNPALKLFLNNGFTEETRTDKSVTIRKIIG